MQQRAQQRAFYIGYFTALAVVVLIWLASNAATQHELPAPAKVRLQAVKVEREPEEA